MKNIFISLFSLLNLTSSAQSIDENFIEDSSFILIGNQQAKYTGTYRNGKCYNGYFKTRYREYEISLVDYYEKGELKYQYSKLYDPGKYVYEEKEILETRSLCKNAKIFDGTEYAFINKGLVTKKWNNGNLETFTVHVFATNYYNGFLFEKIDNNIRVTNALEEGHEIRYVFNEHLIMSEFNSPEFNIQVTENVEIDLSNLPKSSLIYYNKFKDQLFANQKLKLKQKASKCSMLTYRCMNS